MSMHAFEMNNPEDDETVDNRPGWLAIVISLLVLAALLASLILPVLRAERPRPTPLVVYSKPGTANGLSGFNLSLTNR